MEAEWLAPLVPVIRKAEKIRLWRERKRRWLSDPRIMAKEKLRRARRYAATKR